MPDRLIEDAPEGVNIPEFSVSEISLAVKRLIEGEFGHVRVRGEIGRISRPRSGHVYLDLKDESAVLAAVIWRGTASRLDIEPEEGDEVIAEGRLTTYPGQSKYQLVIERLVYAGEGALLAKLERLRKKLATEGLFDDARKKPIPWLPRVIGVVTSPSGAVIRDILHRLEERFPVRVLVWPVAVQGEACATEVAAAIRGFARLPEDGPIPRPDLVIVARGGGSLEDLWGFNDERVVRAAAECPMPLISAVGHETDWTLLDYAADWRAPTPTAAAEKAVPVRVELLATVEDLGARLVRALARGIESRRQRLADLSRALPKPAQILAERRQRLDVVLARLPSLADLLARRREHLMRRAGDLDAALRHATQRARVRFERIAARLRPRLLTLGLERAADRLAALARLYGSLHYEETLRRGFAIVHGEGDRVLTRAVHVTPGAALSLQFADGRVGAVAEGPTSPRRAPSRGTPARGARSACTPPRGGQGDDPQGRLF